MKLQGIKVENIQELEALIKSIEKYSGELEATNRSMSRSIEAAQSWFQGPNYERVSQAWTDSSKGITVFLREVPGIIKYLRDVHGTISDLLGKKL